MNQPHNPVPPRSARPQLFSEPAAHAKPIANAKRHADFGPSILATIDGGQTRFSTARDRSPIRRVLLMAVLALVLAATYVAVKFTSASGVSAPDRVVAVAPVSAMKPVEAPASAILPAVTAGAAAIETVTPVAAAPALAASAPSIKGASSFSNIQLALDRAETVVIAKPKAAEVKREPTARTAVAPAAAAEPMAKRTRSTDSDADLLAAMLPYVSRGAVAPTSLAYEKRCGQLEGKAVVNCRAKFCNGRLGVDAACPEPAVPAAR